MGIPFRWGPDETPTTIFVFFLNSYLYCIDIIIILWKKCFSSCAKKKFFTEEVKSLIASQKYKWIYKQVEKKVPDLKIFVNEFYIYIHVYLYAIASHEIQVCLTYIWGWSADKIACRFSMGTFSECDFIYEIVLFSLPNFFENHIVNVAPCNHRIPASFRILTEI